MDGLLAHWSVHPSFCCRWTSQVGPDAFVPVTSSHPRPSFITSVSDLNDLPALAFSSCPLVNGNLKLHAYMTLFFVLSPAQIKVRTSLQVRSWSLKRTKHSSLDCGRAAGQQPTGTPPKAQKFFGNSPYGQFLLNAGKPGFFSTGGLRELPVETEATSADKFYLLTYRLLGSAVELRMNQSQWRHGVPPSSQPPPVEPTGDHHSTTDTAPDAFAVRMSNNAVLSLGNVKPLCDSNAFQGRFAEVLVFETVLSDDRVARVERYLERKWWREPFTHAVAGGGGDQETNDVTTAKPVEDGTKPTADSEQYATDKPHFTEATPAVKSDPPSTVAKETQPPRVQTVEEESTQTDAPSPSFDPEGVFEWTPPQALLAAKPSERTQQLASEWARAVRESVESIRSFSLGGNVLRAFIRSRKDELLALRQELFG